MTSEAKQTERGRLAGHPKELIDQFVHLPMSAEAVNAASLAFKKALIERALGAELTHDLGYPSGAKPEATGNQHNGASGKTALTELGPLRIDIPRDREGSLRRIKSGAKGKVGVGK